MVEIMSTGALIRGNTVCWIYLSNEELIKAFTVTAILSYYYIHIMCVLNLCKWNRIYYWERLSQ